MPKRKLTNLTLYRRRTLIGYAVVIVVLAAMLTLGLFIPGGLTPAERQSAVMAGTGHLGINAPYYALQKLSIHLLGLSSLSIKLPSVILGGLLGAGLFLLLRRWLSLTIAIFSALIIISGVTFLSLVGTGSPLILYVLYPVLLIYFGTRVLAHDRGLVTFSLLLLATIALALLTPTMAYLVVLAIVIAAANPHVRYGFRRLPTAGLVLLGLGFIVSLAPVTAGILTGRLAIGEILALPGSLTLSSIGANLAVLIPLYGRFLHPGLTAGLPAPLIGLSTAGLAVIGLYKTVWTVYTARAQFIIGWSVIALVLALIDAGLGILLFLPAVLLASLGLSHLAAIWYRTFPLNPYARVIALLPIGVLIGGVIASNLTRYGGTVTYAAGSTNLYSHDLGLLQRAVATDYPKGPVTLYVPTDDVAFYSLLTARDDSVIRSVRPLSELPQARDFTVSTVQRTDGMLVRIVTDARAAHADRFYLYK